MQKLSFLKPLIIVRNNLKLNVESVRAITITEYCTVIVEIAKNTDLFQNTCFKENNNMAVEKISKY